MKKKPIVIPTFGINSKIVEDSRSPKQFYHIDYPNLDLNIVAFMFAYYNNLHDLADIINHKDFRVDYHFIITGFLIAKNLIKAQLFISSSSFDIWKIVKVIENDKIPTEYHLSLNELLYVFTKKQLCGLKIDVNDLINYLLEKGWDEPAKSWFLKHDEVDLGKLKNICSVQHLKVLLDSCLNTASLENSLNSQHNIRLDNVKEDLNINEKICVDVDHNSLVSSNSPLSPYNKDDSQHLLL